MFYDLDAGDQVKPVADRVDDRRDPAVRLHVAAHARNGEIGYINALGFDSSVPQGFHQEAHRAAGIEHAARPERSHDLVCDPAEQRRKGAVAIVRNGAGREAPGSMQEGVRRDPP